MCRLFLVFPNWFFDKFKKKSRTFILFPKFFNIVSIGLKRKVLFTILNYLIYLMMFLVKVALWEEGIFFPTQWKRSSYVKYTQKHKCLLQCKKVSQTVSWFVWDFLLLENSSPRINCMYVATNYIWFYAHMLF